MGSSSSKNVLKGVNEIFNKSVAQVVQDNSVTMAASNTINVEGCSNVNVMNNTQENIISVNVDAVSNAVISDEFTNKLKSQITQLSKAVTQQLNLNPGHADAQNIAESMNKIGTELQRSFSQNCRTTLMGSNRIQCKDSNNVNIAFNTQRNVMTSLVKCSQISIANSKVANDLISAIQQTAVAKNENMFGPLSMIVMMIVAGVVAALVFGGKSTSEVLRSPWPWGTALAGGGAYLGVSKYTSSGPFAVKANAPDKPMCGLDPGNKQPKPCPAGKTCTDPDASGAFEKCPSGQACSSNAVCASGTCQGVEPPYNTGTCK